MRRGSVLAAVLLGVIAADSGPLLASDVLFHATFDRGFDADRARGGGEATVVGEVDLVEGMTGRAARIRGQGGQLRYLRPGNLDQRLGTLEMWVRPLDWQWDDPTMFTFARADSEPGNIFHLFKYAGAASVFFYCGNVVDRGYPHDHMVRGNMDGWDDAQAWRQLVVTWNNFEIRAYADGEYLSYYPYPQPERLGGTMFQGVEAALGEHFTIGGNSFDPAAGSTAVDEVIIYNRTLSEDEIRQRYQMKTGGRPDAQPTAFGVPLADAPPTVDGSLDAEEWREAAGLNGFAQALATYADLRSEDHRVHAATDGRHLYLGLRGEPLVGAAPPRDDRFEVFISPDGESVHHYEVSASGGLTYRSPDGGDATEAQAAARSTGPGGLTAEIRIPVEEVGLESPLAAGASFSMLVMRAQESETGRLHASLPWTADPANVEDYARITVVAPGGAVQAELSLDTLAEGRLGVELRAGRRLSEETAASVRVLDMTGRAIVERRVLLGAETARIEAEVARQFTGTLVLDVGEVLYREVPLRLQPAVTVDYEIDSGRNHLQVTVDGSGARVEPQRLSAVVTVEDPTGAVVIEHAAPQLHSPRERLGLEIEPLGHGRHLLRAQLRDEADRLVGEHALPLMIYRELEGVPNALGVTDEAPAPWTPVAAGPDGRLEMWGKQYVFNGGLLPRELHVLGEDVLAGPMHYRLRLRGDREARVVRDAQWKLEETREGYAVATVRHESPGLQIRQRVRAEFDGMIRFDVEIEADAGLDRFALEIPVRREFTRFFLPAAWRGRHLEGREESELADGEVWRSPHMYPCVYVTSYDKGLSWFAGSDRSWVVDEGRDRMLVRPEGMTVTFVDTEGEAVHKLALTFGIQAMPMRPPREDSARFTNFHEPIWTVFFEPAIGNVTLEQGLREMRDGWEGIRQQDRVWGAANWLLLPFANFPRGIEHARGAVPDDLYDWSMEILPEALEDYFRKYEYLVPYLTPTYTSEAIPEWEFFWSEWQHLPRHTFSTWRQPQANVADQRYVDFFLHALREYLSEHEVNGMFHDMYGVYNAFNPEYDLGYVRGGTEYDEYPLWETRELFKRMYVLHRDLFPDAMNVVNFGTVTPPLHSFADFLLTGEKYLGTSQRSIYDVDTARGFALHSAPFAGQKTVVLSWQERPELRADRAVTIHMYGLVLLMDAGVWTGRDHGGVRIETGALKDRFGIGGETEIEFVPFWKGADQIDTADSEDVLAAAYVREDGRAMLVFVNATDQADVRAPVTVNLASLGIEQVRNVTLYDPLANEYSPLPVEQEEGRMRFTLNIEKALYRAVLINDPEGEETTP